MQKGANPGSFDYRIVDKRSPMHEGWWPTESECWSLILEPINCSQLHSPAHKKHLSGFDLSSPHMRCESVHGKPYPVREQWRERGKRAAPAHEASLVWGGWDLLMWWLRRPLPDWQRDLEETHVHHRLVRPTSNIQNKDGIHGDLTTQNVLVFTQMNSADSLASNKKPTSNCG